MYITVWDALVWVIIIVISMVMGWNVNSHETPTGFYVFGLEMVWPHVNPDIF